MEFKIIRTMLRGLKNKKMKKHSIALREAKSREINENNEYGMYSEIFDRRNSNGRESVSRYIERGDLLPSPQWTKKFVQAGGGFDSCGVWGISPREGVELEARGIQAEFAGKMLALLGRADYDYSHVDEVFFSGVNPVKRAEFHACVRGLSRKELSDKAECPQKSTMRLGWMTEPEFFRHILETSRVVVSGNTGYHHFNGVPMWEIEGMKAINNPVFSSWMKNRPSESEMDSREKNKQPLLRPVAWLESIPPHLVAVAMRHNRKYLAGYYSYPTSVGHFVDCGDGYLVFNYKTVKGRKLRNDLSVVQIKGVWFAWNPMVGFSHHMENASLKGAVDMWEKRSRKGEPRPLCLNDVRNDRTGTAGFCLAGTKSFLRHKMPFVYHLISGYSSWSEIPEDIMAEKWDVDFRIFKGYPIP